MRPNAPLLLKAALLGGVAAAALASALPARAEVGVASAVNVDARGRPPGAAPRVISLGSNVVFKEEITTDQAGLVQILLLDGTTFTVGPNSQLTIDEFVYNPDTGDAKVVASLTKGVFRFVGARTSQTEGGATVKTPVGTIGIRGGVANFSCDGGECKASLVAGKSLTIVDGDGTQRIVYETGYTAVITQDAGGGTTTTVRKATKEETGLIQKQLASKPGQNGGNSGAPPSDEQTQEVTENNSGQFPDTMQVPGSTNPVQSSDPEQAEDVAGIDGKTQEDINDDIANEEQPNARLLTAAADGYVIDPDNGGGTFPDPGPRGLVGSTPDSDQGVILAVEGERLKTSNGSLDLPDYSGVNEDEGDPPEAIYPGIAEIPISVGEATYLGQDLGGVAYAGSGNFVTYLLGINGDPTQPVYVIYGTPTADAQEIFTDDNVVIREYALTPDPISPIEEIGIPVVPFFRDDAYGAVNALYYDGDEYLTALSSTNLFVVEGEGGNVRTYQSWIHISGEGAGQKSAAFLYTGGMFEGDDGSLQMGGARRGTFRANADEGPVNMRGGINTIAGATGEHFFGQNANNFVIGTSVKPADAFSDAPLDFDDVFTGNPEDGYLQQGYPFATTHVANLYNETAITEYEVLPVGRTSRDVTGFAAGMGEAFIGDPVYEKEAPYVLAGTGPNFTLNLDAGTSMVHAEVEVFDVLNQNATVESLLVSFGPDEEFGGGSAFVDDHIFGAQKNNDPAKTRLRTDGGGIGDDGPNDVAHTSQFTPGSYLISGRANPIDGYQHCEECDFIDWGWWGTRMEVAAGASDEIPQDRTDYVHMGTWVAGDITDPSVDVVPTSGTATFAGTTLGTVQANGAQYIASGTVGMTYDFNTRGGNIAITLDGMSVGGLMANTSTADQLTFGGALSGTGLSGSAAGAVVNDGSIVAAGILGNFSFGGAGVSAVGTFAGID